ncbi:MAG: carboxypeptidase-like regulatory domain-containing protein, partial [Candidatus Sulfotelmatobacter sp.]
MQSRNAIVKIVRNSLCVSLLCLCAASLALAQAGRGGVSGLVTDPAGAVVPGARVVLLNKATGVSQNAVTSSG